MSPPDLLNLPAYRVLHVDTTDHDYHISAEVINAPQRCPHCLSDRLEGFGRREQMLRDLPMHARRVGLYVNTRRYRCKQCNKTFYETLPDADGKRLMTKRLVAWVGKQAVKRTFLNIAEEIGVTEGTIRLIFKDYVSDLEKTVRFETPKWMGIDEIHLIKPRGVIANIQNNTIVELLPNRNKETVVRFLQQLEGKDRIQYVAMDMWAPYRDACKAVIPQAEIVVDKFHVLKMANEALERVRKSLRESLTPKQRRGLMHDRFVLLKRERELDDRERLLLSGWLKNYPELGEAYRLKEDFFRIYDAESPDEAQACFINWKRSVIPEVADAFADIIRAWENWEPWILTYFDHPVTNAYTESLNSLIRVMNRLGRGYSFEALRAKILFSEGVHKNKLSRPKFARKTPDRRQAETMGFGVPENARGYEMMTSFSRTITTPQPKPCPPPKSIDFEKSEKNYGADISTLIRLIESGEL